MNTRIDAGAAGTPQVPTDNTLARVLAGDSGGQGTEAQRTLQLTTPGGAAGRANRAMPTQNNRRTQTPWMTPLANPPLTEGEMRSPMLREPKLREPKRCNMTAVPMPIWTPKQMPNVTAVPMPIWRPKQMPNVTAVPMPIWRPKGEAVPSIVSGEWSRRVPPVCFDFEKAPPRVERAPITDVKGTGKPSPKPSEQVFTSPAQQQAFKSVVHLNDGRRGSGVVVANKGNEYMLLTNQHCLIGKKVGESVNFTLSDGTKLKGKIAAIGNPNMNDGHDLAAITFTSTRKLEPAKIATTEPEVEQNTFSIGFPYSGTHTETSNPSDRVDPRTGAMVAEGRVTANRRDGEGQIKGEYGLVTSSTVIQGMSGGGMFDAATGELVAINGRDANPIIPPLVQDGKTFSETVGKEGRSIGIAAAEIGQFLLQNKAALPDFARS